MSATPSGRDKRRFERIRIASLRHVWNLSEGGAFIATETPKRLGAKIHMELRLGREGPTFRSLAKVVRVLHRPNPKFGEPAGMAVQFVDLTDEQLSILKEFLAEAHGQPDSVHQP
jgi:hypothetical protein